MGKKFSGKKFSKEHTTATDAAVPIVKLAEKLPEVDKIVLGPITQCSSGRGAKALKIKEIPAGLEISVRGGSTAQKLWLYCRDTIETKKRLAEFEAKKL
jgi:hypothetical protein